LALFIGRQPICRLISMTAKLYMIQEWRRTTLTQYSGGTLIASRFRDAGSRDQARFAGVREDSK